MNAIELCEQGLVPDWLTRVGMRRLMQQRLEDETADRAEAQHAKMRARLKELSESPLALHTDAANEQHYEVPAAFFQLALGRRLKYSCCYFPEGVDDLDVAEEIMLELTCERAQLEDGQDVLELGCGWGSLTLWMAEHYPGSRITAVSNSDSQRAHILGEARDRGLDNIEVITCDMNDFAIDRSFDRVVSVEMFEHMRNYRVLMERISRWLRPGGKLFVHIFCHRELLYPFEVQGEDDWMSKYFFTGGLMPSETTLLEFQEHLTIDDRWRLSGRHYERTAEAWLQNMDQRRETLLPVLENAYGEDAKVWFQRWRMFFMACAELFGYRDGTEWLVGHYRFVKP